MSIERFLFGRTIAFLIFLFLAVLYSAILIIVINYDYKKQKKKIDKAYCRVILFLTVVGFICAVLFKTLFDGIV